MLRISPVRPAIGRGCGEIGGQATDVDSAEGKCRAGGAGSSAGGQGTCKLCGTKVLRLFLSDEPPGCNESMLPFTKRMHYQDIPDKLNFSQISPRES